MDDLLREFLTETTDQISDLEGSLRRFSANPNDTRLQGQIQQLFHTIKAAGGFLALPRLEAIAGAGERYLGRLKEGAVEAMPDTPVVVADTIREIVTLLEATAKAESEPSGDDTGTLAILTAAAAGELKPKAPPPPPEPEPIVEQNAAVSSPSANLPEVAPTMSGGALALVADGIEQITDLVGELIHTRNNLNCLVLERDDPELEAPVRRLDLITTGLGHRVFEIGSLTEHGDAPFDLVTAIAVECAGGLFALPRETVVEVTAAGWDRDFLVALRTEKPKTSLARLLGKTATQTVNDIAVTIATEEGQISLRVDRASTVEEMVVRALPPLLGGIDLYCGVGLLGDGRIAIMLDPNKIVRAADAGTPLALPAAG